MGVRLGSARMRSRAARSNSRAASSSAAAPGASASAVAPPFAPALESGHVTTRHILVVQHDRCFMRPFDLSRAVGCMRADARVRYLLVPTRSVRTHAQTIAGKCAARLPRIVANGVRLQALGFWWDSTHLATADHYLRFVLAERCVKRGAFPEDTLGKQLLAEVKAHGAAAAERYHAYVWDDFERPPPQA